MIAFSLFINFYAAIVGYVYSRDRREWWDLSQEEKEGLIRKHLSEDEYTDSCEGTFPDGWFDLEDWEKKAILDKNLDEYYKDEANQELDFKGISKHQECKYHQGWGRCVIV